MANEHLPAVEDVVNIDMAGYEPRATETMGYLQPGQYEVEIEAASLVNKGKNLKLVLRDVNFGIRLFSYIPVTTNPGEKDYETVQALIYSIATANSKIKIKNEMQISVKRFVGKRAYVRIENRELGGRTACAIAAFITKEQWGLAPQRDARCSFSYWDNLLG